MSEPEGQQRVVTLTDAVSALASALAMSQAAIIHALHLSGAVRAESVRELLLSQQPHHPDPWVADVARQMIRATAMSLDLADTPRGQA